MGNGPEIAIQLALRLKPAAFGIKGTIDPEVITNALNAVRLFGHSQILVLGRNAGCDVGRSWNERDDERLLTHILVLISSMQVKDREIEATIGGGRYARRAPERRLLPDRLAPQEVGGPQAVFRPRALTSELVLFFYSKLSKYSLHITTNF